MSDSLDPADAPDPVEHLLADCLAAPVDEIEAMVDDACTRHPQHAIELRRRLDSLRALGVLRQEPQDPDIPARLGRFRLLRRLGGGGMGIVHLAVEEPLGRQVALKLIRPEQLWFENARKRFLREAEAVAALSHPGIVAIRAVGEQDGVPFCAMEFVEGRSLGEILRGLRGHDPATVQPDLIGQPGARSWTDACFAVALQIASALQHAHSRGVIHRDVKPSNVMLDGDGRARLIDFGLARLLHDESMTRTGIQPGSLAYMSPEQVRGEDIDERTDVYSLGVTLYELLALRMPFQAANEEQMRRAILDASPPPIDAIHRAVPADAAAVVERAMAPERKQRYPDMAAFSADLAAFLEHRAVTAKRPGPLLRLHRFAQRRPALATALLFGFLLVTGLPTTLLVQERSARKAIEVEAERARLAESSSERAATKAKRVVAFLQDLFYESEPARARGERVLARTILDRGVQQIRAELREEPEVRAALLAAMGAVYLNLGLLDQAKPLLVECDELQRGNARTTPADRRQVLLLEAQLAGWSSDHARQEALVRQALATLPAPAEDADAADVLSALGSAIGRQGRLAEAEILLREAIDHLRRLERGEGTRLGRALQSLATFLQDRVDPQAAAPVFAESSMVLDRVLAHGHPLRIAAAGNQAINLTELGRLAEAQALLEEQLAIAQHVFDAEHPRRAALEEQLAVVLLRRGRPEQAMPHLEAALHAYSATLTAPNPFLARALNLECSIAVELEDLPRAARAADAALAMYETLFPAGSFDFAMVLGNLVRIRTTLGQLREAVDLGRRAVAMHESLDQQDAVAVALVKSHLARALALAGEHAAAQSMLPPPRAELRTDRELRIAAYRVEVLLLAGRTADAAGSLASLDPVFADEELPPGLRAWLLFLRGWLRNQSGDAPAAILALQDCIALRSAAYGDGSLPVAQARTELAVATARNRDVDGAALLLEQAEVSFRNTLGNDNPFRVLPLLNLAAVRKLQQRPQDAIDLAAEVLRIQVVHHSGDQRTGAALQLVLRAVPELADPAARRTALANALVAARSILPEDHDLVRQLAAAATAAGGSR
ncbi:MAG: serine/threonine protein kinase [Planctomycetes bacterium]|nr:serine/threonine protein kinase [Planctomycetota bacterium]